MANVTASILVPIDVSAGSTAVDYTPTSTGCPILAFNCRGSSGSGNVKVTPLKATLATVGGTGTGGRLRIATNAIGSITTVEIAAGGTGYSNGPVAITLEDPYGSGGAITCTASGGALSAVSIGASGFGYSGYVTYDVSDFIEGVTYDIVPRFIEQTSGSGVLNLVGYKVGFRPFQSY